MIFIFLDTSSDNLIISLLKNYKILSTKEIKSLNDHSSYIIKLIKEILDENSINIKDISKIFCTVGPGSFTGTRIGVTVAKTLAFSLNKKVVPISSLKQYIFGHQDYDYIIPVVEDKRGIYYSIYNSNYKELFEEKYVLKDLFFEEIKKLNGNVLLISDNDYKNYKCVRKKIDIESMIKFYDSFDGINAHELKPNYIKKIEVESKL